MGADYLVYVKTIETHARSSLALNILAIDSVTCLCILEILHLFQPQPGSPIPVPLCQVLAVHIHRTCFRLQEAIIDVDTMNPHTFVSAPNLQVQASFTTGEAKLKSSQKSHMYDIRVTN